jgi:hypothetical protein
MEDDRGVTEIDNSVGLTVSVVEAAVDDVVALMVTVPNETAVAKPLLPVVLVIVATRALEEDHPTDCVMS